MDIGHSNVQYPISNIQLTSRSSLVLPFITMMTPWRRNTYRITGFCHHSDVIMNAMVSQITGVSIVYPTVCFGADQRKHQRSTSLAFVRGIHRRPVNSPHKGPVTRRIFLFDDVIMLRGTQRSSGGFSSQMRNGALALPRINSPSPQSIHYSIGIAIVIHHLIRSCNPLRLVDSIIDRKLLHMWKYVALDIPTSSFQTAICGTILHLFCH